MTGWSNVLREKCTCAGISHILCFSPQLIFLSLPFLFISPRNDHALFDNSSFGKLIVEGREAAEALDWICRY